MLGAAVADHLLRQPVNDTGVDEFATIVPSVMIVLCTDEPLTAVLDRYNSMAKLGKTDVAGSEIITLGSLVKSPVDGLIGSDKVAFEEVKARAAELPDTILPEIAPVVVIVIEKVPPNSPLSAAPRAIGPL